MTVDASILNNFQNILDQYGKEMFEKGWQDCLKTMNKQKEARRAKIVEKKNKLLEELRDEIWSKEEGNIADRKYEQDK